MHADVISDHLLQKVTNSFWRAWNSNYNKSNEIPVSVACLNNPSDIGSAFKDLYSNIYVKSSDDVDATNEFFLSYYWTGVYNFR